MAMVEPVGATPLRTIRELKRAGTAGEQLRLFDEETKVLPPIGRRIQAQPLLFDPGEAYQALKNEDEISVDIETSGLNPWVDKIAVIALHGHRSGVVSVHHLRGAPIPLPIKALLEKPGRTLVGHNVVGFDALFFATAGIDVFKAAWVDTLVTELVTLKSGRRDVRVNLAATIKRRIGVEIDKSIDHRTWMNPTLTEEQLAYVTGDVRFLPSVLKEQRLTVAGTRQAEAMEFELRLMPAILRMVLNGLPFSMEAYGHYLADQVAAKEEAEKALFEAFGDINLRSPIQVKQALAAYGIVLSSTGHDKLVEIAALGGRAGAVVQKILDYREPDQRIKMYSDEWLEKHVYDGKVHARVWQCATDTGRMSNSDPNLQQVPKDEARKVFEAPEGYQIISADYSQIEVRVAAYYARDQAMLEALASEDLHTAVASGIFGKDPGDITSDERKLAKASTFTLLFGGGAGRLYDYARHNGSNIDEQMARDIVNRFFRRFKGLKEMREKAFDRASKPNVVELTMPNGLRRVLQGADKTGTRILNTMVQGTAAVGLKCGLMEAHKRGLTQYIGAAVHDEFVAMAPRAIAGEVAVAIAEAMKDGMAGVIPGCETKVGVEINQTWGGHVITCRCTECEAIRAKKIESKLLTTKSYHIDADNKK